MDKANDMYFKGNACMVGLEQPADIFDEVSVGLVAYRDSGENLRKLQLLVLHWLS